MGSAWGFMYLQMFVMKTMENYMAITHRIHVCYIW